MRTPLPQNSSCLMVAHNYHPAVGAAATRLQLLTEALVEQGHDVTVLTSSTSGRHTGPNGEQVVGTSTGWMPGSRILRTSVLAARALAEAATGRHAVVVSDPPPYVAAAAMVGARIGRAVGVFYYCDSWASVAASHDSTAWKWAGRLFQGLEGAATRLARLTVASTPALEQRARRSGRRVLLVRNGTDLRVYSPDGDTFTGAELPERYFVYAGTMGLVHGAHVFVEAAEQLWAEGHEFGLVFVGSGAESQQIKDAAQASQGRITYLEPVTPTEVAQLYRGSIGALVSMRPIAGYEDAWPVKTLAAMSCGSIPVYVSDGDLAATLRAEGLSFVESHGVDGARRAMQGVLELDEPARRAIEQRCRTYAAENFDQRRAAQSVARTIAELLPRAEGGQHH